ncbi:hypothetical protein IRJ41_002292, partial [Triplophysa rosa]
HDILPNNILTRVVCECEAAGRQELRRCVSVSFLSCSLAMAVMNVHFLDPENSEFAQTKHKLTCMGASEDVALTALDPRTLRVNLTVTMLWIISWSFLCGVLGDFD